MRRSSRVTALAVAIIAPVSIGVGPAFASGGGGGGGSSCRPLTAKVQLSRSDSGESGINVQSTITNCSHAPQSLALTVSVPNSATVPFTFNSGGATLQPGRSITLFADPIGSTPGQLKYGQTYTVTGTLIQTKPTPTTLGTFSTVLTMPPGPVG